MAKLHSLSDLASLLPAEAQDPHKSAKAIATNEQKLGYDGKPQRITLTREKRTGTKTVTLVRGFQSRPDELQKIFQLLKQRCGTGGKLLDNALELQGDHTNTIAEYLRGLGFDVKL
jgi:predicted translation initiation factor SUI1